MNSPVPVPSPPPGQPAGAAAARPVKSIINPWVDTLCVGGGSILLLAPLLWFSTGNLAPLSLEMMGLGTVLLNMPHFIASYRIIYGSRTMIARHPWATIYVPAILVAYAVFSVVTSVSHPEWITVMFVVGGVYLAWHYTGQAWGMMATFAHLDGQPFSEVERRFIRAGLSLLLVWHVTWFFFDFQTGDYLHAVIEPIFSAICLSTVVAAVLGILGLALYARRTGRLPPIQALAAWAAIYLWYAAIARDSRALFWVQIAHSIQYLIFPIRVEINTARHLPSAPPSAREVRWHMIWYAVGLLGGGVLLGHLLPNTGAAWLAKSFGNDYAKAAAMALAAVINIHHYFTDGCIWKLRQPEVRRALFAHVPTGK